MIPCFGYTRVSTVKQGEGVSLEAQKDAIRLYAEKNGLVVTQWFEEKETAAKTGRPVFTSMVKDLRAGKAEGLITHKIDRFSRNHFDWALVGDLAENGIGIHFATESLDFNSRGGRLAADIQAVVAADYSRNLREEARKGIYGRLEQGLYPFKAPLGYLDQGGGKAKIPDPAKAPLIEQLFSLYASGRYSIRSLQAEMADRGLTTQGGKPLTKTGIEKILSNSFYAGVITIRKTGQCFKGSHKTLIKVATYERVQALKMGRYGKKTVKHDFLLRRLVKCGSCGSFMTGERQKTYVYFRCHNKECSQGPVRQDDILGEIELALAQYELADEVFERIAKKLRSEFDQKFDTGTQLANVRLQLEQTRSRLDRLTDAAVDQIISVEDFQTRKSSALLAIAKLEETEKQLLKSSDALSNLLKFFELVKSLAALYKIAKQHEKRELIEIAFSNLTVHAKSLDIEPSIPLRMLRNVVGVSNGGPYKDTFRTTPEMRKAQLMEIFNPDSDLSITDLVEQLSRIFEKYGNIDQKPDNAI